MKRNLLAVGTAFIASSCAFGAYVTDGLVLRYDAIDNAGAGARILPDLSWVHVDRRAKIWRQANTEARINLNYIVFEAKAPEIELSFTDAAAKPGERLGLNWIFLAKYLK